MKRFLFNYCTREWRVRKIWLVAAQILQHRIVVEETIHFFQEQSSMEAVSDQLSYQGRWKVPKTHPQFTNYMNNIIGAPAGRKDVVTDS